MEIRRVEGRIKVDLVDGVQEGGIKVDLVDGVQEGRIKG
jgi:hypothetical protein